MKASSYCHREKAGTLGMVPLIINPIYTLYTLIEGIYWVYPKQSFILGVKQLGYHPKGTSLFPWILEIGDTPIVSPDPWSFREENRVCLAMLPATSNLR